MADVRRPTVQGNVPAATDLDRAARAVMGAPSAKTFAFNGSWICPMCNGVYNTIAATTANWMERAILHLKNDCQAIRSGQRIPKTPPDQLRKTGLNQAVRFAYAADPTWKMRDFIGNWYCPYCITSGLRVASQPPFAPAEVELILSHVLRCASFNGGAGTPKTAAQIRHAIDQSNAKLERNVRVILSNQASKIFSFEHFWICPMCGKIIPEITKDVVNWQDMAAKHLREVCPPVKEGQLASKLPPYQLKKNVLAEGLHHVIPVDPIYQIRDRSGRWYCPFCMHGPVTVTPPNGKLSVADIKAIAGHILPCFYFESGRATPRDPAKLEEIVRQANSKLDASSGLDAKLKEDPVWRVRDRNGCWVCPYCRKPVLSVSFSPIRAEDAVDDVSQHLLKSCDAYRQKKAPARDVSELTVIEERTKVVARTVAEERTELIQVDRKIYEMMVRMAKDHVIQKSDTHQEMEGMLVSAQKTQMKMLPKAPILPGIEIEVLYRPSQHLSGDFYDFVRYDPEHLGFIIGDVSGHGIDAALVMGMAKKVLAMAGRMQVNPKEVLSYANEMIRPDLDRGTFITACYGVLHLQERMFRFSSAGHNPVLLYNAARGDQPVAMRPAGIALGIADNAQMESVLEQMELSLQEGDVVILYTDGVVEQPDPAGEMLQIEGLMEIVQQHGGGEARHLLAAIDRRLTEFRGSKAQEDDVTVVCIRVLSGGTSGPPADLPPDYPPMPADLPPA
jgi:serine phosphatase RsbU (regulator of sigma subunit)